MLAGKIQVSWLAAGSWSWINHGLPHRASSLPLFSSLRIGEILSLLPCSVFLLLGYFFLLYKGKRSQRSFPPWALEQAGAAPQQGRAELIAPPSADTRGTARAGGALLPLDVLISHRNTPSLPVELQAPFPVLAAPHCAISCSLCRGVGIEGDSDRQVTVTAFPAASRGCPQCHRTPRCVFPPSGSIPSALTPHSPTAEPRGGTGLAAGGCSQDV